MERNTASTPPSLKEPELQAAILISVGVLGPGEEVAATVQQIGREVLNEDGAGLPEQIEELDQEMARLLEKAAQQKIDPALLEEKFRAMSREKARLAGQLEEAERQAQGNQAKAKELARVLERLRAQEISLAEFDDSFIRRVVEQVTVLSDERIEVRFVGGVVKEGRI